MERWAERFKELYPEDGYEVLFSDPNTKLMAIQVPSEQIRLIRIKILRNTHIVGTCLYIIRRHYVGIRKFRIIQIKIAVDHGNHHVAGRPE